jgi:predicted glycosyltransferase involved in capsule biosynthesis
VDAIKKNIGRVIAIATGEEDESIRSGAKENPLLSKITNAQAAEIIDIICRENYMVAGKKFKSLIAEMKQTFLSKTP